MNYLTNNCLERMHDKVQNDENVQKESDGPKWKSSFGKCYGNQNGIMFSIDSIKLLNPEERKGKLKAIASQNAGSAEDVKKCETLVHFFKCQKKRMTTREVTCKESPIVVNKKLE